MPSSLPRFEKYCVSKELSAFFCGKATRFSFHALTTRLPHFAQSYLEPF